MLYVFTTTRYASRRMYVYKAYKNYGLDVNEMKPFKYEKREYDSEAAIVDRIRNAVDKMSMYQEDYYFFTLSSLEFATIRMLVKQTAIPGGVKVIVFGEKGEIVEEYEINEYGGCDVLGDFDIFDTHHDVLSALL